MHRSTGPSPPSHVGQTVTRRTCWADNPSTMTVSFHQAVKSFTRNSVCFQVSVMNRTSLAIVVAMFASSATTRGEDAAGVRLTADSVRKGCPSAESGLKAGDRVLALDGKPLTGGLGELEL